MNILDSLTGLVAPHVCLGCGSLGSVLCGDCTVAYYEPLQPRCAGCKKLSKDFRVCTSCRSWLPIKSVYVASIYDGVAEQLIRSLKFESQRTAAEPIARLIGETICDIQDEPLLCPIPTAPARIRERGFDHALLIAKKLSTQTGFEFMRLLNRHTNVRQLGSSRAERMKQMESEFVIIRNPDIAGKHVLIVDDVMTTGATLSSAARELKKAGAKSVSAVVFAQKL
jgi:ComF family protein